jgi:hypothetical protein
MQAWWNVEKSYIYSCGAGRSERPVLVVFPPIAAKTARGSPPIGKQGDAALAHPRLTGRGGEI